MDRILERRERGRRRVGVTNGATFRWGSEAFQSGHDRYD